MNNPVFILSLAGPKYTSTSGLTFIVSTGSGSPDVQIYPMPGSRSGPPCHRRSCIHVSKPEEKQEAKACYWDFEPQMNTNNNNNNNNNKVTITKSEKLDLHPNTYTQMQKSVILDTCSIVRNFLNYK